MQIVSLGDNLHEMSNPNFWRKKKEKKNIINLSSADFMLSCRETKDYLRLRCSHIHEEPCYSARPIQSIRFVIDIGAATCEMVFSG